MAAAARHRDRDRATELVADAERAALATARSIIHAPVQVMALADMVRAAAGVGDDDRARVLAADAERAARSINNPDQQAQALADVARAATAVGDYDRAEQAARSVTDPFMRARVLAGVVKAAADTGDQNRARRLAADAERAARSINNPDQQAQALADVASSVNEPGTARSCIAGALAAGAWTASLQALALVDATALSAFADELEAYSYAPGTPVNGPLSGTSAEVGAERSGTLVRQRPRDSRTLSCTSPIARRSPHLAAAHNRPIGVRVDS